MSKLWGDVEERDRKGFMGNVLRIRNGILGNIRSI
jgi:hypothetical protein